METEMYAQISIRLVVLRTEVQGALEMVEEVAEFNLDDRELVVSGVVEEEVCCFSQANMGINSAHRLWQ